MENFRKVKIKDHCEITSSKRIFADEYLSSGVPFYRGKEISQKQRSSSEVSDLIYISREKFEEIKTKYDIPQKGDLLLTSVGTIGNPYLVKENEEFYFKDGNLTWFRNFQGINGQWLYYWLLSPQGRSELNKCTIGSSQKAYTINLLYGLQIELPDPKTQTRIASVLSAYDDLIENNEKRIKALEEMAQLLYTEWFVNYSPPVEGWQAKPDGVVSSRSTQHYMSLPYNPKLKDRARELRKAGNLSEVLFWQQVKNGKFNGLDFDRQKIIGNYIVDFYCANMGLVIEIDGSSHDDKQEYDEERNNYLSSLGLTVIHIPDIEIKKNLEGVMEVVRKRIGNHEGKPPRHCCGTPPREGNELPLHGRGMKMIDSGTEYGMVPEGWEVKKLKEIGKAITGKTPPTGNLENFDGNVLFIKTPDIHGNIFVLETEQTLSEIGAKTQLLKLLPEKTVFVSCIGTLGVVGITSKPSQTNQQINALILNDISDYCFFYFFAKSLKEKLIGLGSNGSTMGNVNKDKFENINILYPSEKIRKSFYEATTNLFDEILSLQKKNQNLSKTRDLLIPQLVTGKRELKISL